MLLEFQERMIRVEEWWFCTERGLCVGNPYLTYRSLHKSGKGSRKSGGKEHDNSSAGEE